MHFKTRRDRYGPKRRKKRRWGVVADFVRNSERGSRRRGRRYELDAET